MVLAHRKHCMKHRGRSLEKIEKGGDLIRNSMLFGNIACQRPYKVSTGYGSGGTSTTLSSTDTIYDTCGCTPIGKPYQVSMPYAPGATPVYKVNTYDAIGRTLTTVLPDGTSTTSYSYQGNIVTVTDPAGKWKQYTTDAFGELTQVLEPSPNPATEPNHVTTYTYDLLGHLTQAQMPRTVNG